MPRPRRCRLLAGDASARTWGRDLAAGREFGQGGLLAHVLPLELILDGIGEVDRPIRVARETAFG